MTFLWPVMLCFLALVPVMLLAYLRVQQQRRARLARYGSLGSLGAAGHLPAWRRHLPPALFLAALVILILAMARPIARVTLPRLEGTVILVFDVSASMAAEDMEPSRMEAARVAAQTFVEAQPSTVRLGVVAFSNSGLEVQVPTEDQQLVLAALGRLEPQRGTSLGQGILAGLAALAEDNNGDAEAGVGGAEQTGPGEPGEPEAGFQVPDVSHPESTAIILFSDGENNETPDPLEVAVAARGQGVRIYTVGLGSQEGITLELDGFSVHTQLDEALLQQVAQLSGGAYYRAADQEALSAVYDDVAAQLVVRGQEMEVTALLAGAAIGLLLLGGALSLVWFGRVP
jgi:Ca-activated chloride channel family protein